ncbi:hypothetical protein MUK42_35205 [Musa troglodytarum]|uniref:Uncharacterized protein n=1 Tax=Musa troglodytarum TaxID=320322 RepID=A0A9E7JZ43_9LILI|nr:hypothetical protein MUK42_35205 [Musa troglodytarum]
MMPGSVDYRVVRVDSVRRRRAKKGAIFSPTSDPKHQTANPSKGVKLAAAGEILKPVDARPTPSGSPKLIFTYIRLSHCRDPTVVTQPSPSGKEPILHLRWDLGLARRPRAPLRMHSASCLAPLAKVCFFSPPSPYFPLSTGRSRQMTSAPVAISGALQF